MAAYAANVDAFTFNEELRAQAKAYTWPFWADFVPEITLPQVSVHDLMGLSVSLFVITCSLLLIGKGIIYYRESRELLRQRRARFDRSNRIPESMRPDSYLGTNPPLRSQVAVYSLMDGVKYFEGSGVRILDYIVVPTHVLTPEAHFFYSQQVLGAGKVPTLEWHHLDLGEIANPLDNAIARAKEIFPDVTVVKMPPSAVSTIPAAKVASVAGRPFVRCLSTRKTHNVSYGTLSTEAEAGFGMFSYSGSTTKGFSGGIYLDVDHVVGMHLGGGQINYGVSLALIKQRLERMSKVPESSEMAAISRALGGARKRDVQVLMTGDPDVVEIQVGGKFFTVDVDEYRSLQEEEKFEHFFFDDEDRPRKQFRREYENLHQPIEEEEPPFLGSSSFQLKVEPVTTPQTPCTTQTTGMQTSPDQTENYLDGLRQMQQQFDDLLKRMQLFEDNLNQHLFNQMQKNLPELLDTLLVPTQSDVEDLRSRVTQISDGISIISSELSTLKARPALASSQASPRSVMPSVGMDAAFQKLKQWRSLNSPSNPDYVNCRKEFMDSQGWSETDQAYLINRLRNYAHRLRQQELKKLKAEPVEPIR